MAASMLWALGFAMGVVAWAAVGWVVVHGFRTLTTALAVRADAARSLRLDAEDSGVVVALDPAAGGAEDRLAA